MTTPAKLSGAPASITIDGIDLHSYGFLLMEVDNPTPEVVESQVTIPNKHGALDFTKTYSTRHMNISGKMMADTHAQLMSNIDGLKKLFRLKQNGETFQVIIQDQTDRYWSCRYGGGISISMNSVVIHSKTAAVYFPLYCTKPYSEKTTLTTETFFMHLHRDYKIDYAGTFPAPLAIEMRPRFYENLVEKKLGDLSEDNSLMSSQINCFGSDAAGSNLYGTNRTVWTRAGGGSYQAVAQIEKHWNLYNT